MSHPPKILSYLSPAVHIVDGQIANRSVFFKISVINHKGNVHLRPQFLIVALTETKKYHTVHIPHGGESFHLAPILRRLYHHKISCFFQRKYQRIQGSGNKTVLQYLPLILLVVVHHHANNPGVILSQQNSCHAWNIMPLLQNLLHPLHRLVRYFSGLPVNHIGNRRRTQPQLLCNIRNPYPLCHKQPLSLPVFPS